jgi:hypothetical protein
MDKHKVRTMLIMWYRYTMTKLAQHQKQPLPEFPKGLVPQWDTFFQIFKKKTSVNKMVSYRAQYYSHICRLLQEEMRC